MKVILFVFLFTLLATSTAVTLKAKAKAVLKALSENIESGDSFKAALKSLLQLTEGDEYADVADIINTVRDEIEDLLSKNQQRLSDEDNSYSSQLQVYESSINDLQSQLDDIEGRLTAGVDSRGNIQLILQNSGTSISEAVAGLDQENARRQASQQSYEDQRQAINEAIAQCEQAAALLREVESEDLPGDNANFLEVRRKRLHNNLLQIEKKVKEIKLNSPVVTFIKTLINIAQTTVNQDILDQIISLINDLENSLRAQLDQVNQDDATDDQTHQSAVANYQSTIASQQSLLQSNQDALVQVTGNSY